MGIRISNSQTILCVLLKVKAVKMDNQQRANIQHVELWRSGAWGRTGTCVYVADHPAVHLQPSLPSLLLLTLFIGYAPIQNIFGVKKKKKQGFSILVNI